MNFEKKYWSVGEFTLQNGESYEGYVGILNGDGYIFDTHDKLVKTNTYYTQFNCGEYFFDRILDEKLELPCTKKEIQFAPNDFMYKGSVKNILQKLQKNNDFIFKCSTISDTLIPAVEDCSILATSNNSKYVFVGKSGKEYDKYDIHSEQDIDDGFVINTKWDDKNGENRFKLNHEDLPKSSYSSEYKFVPNTLYKLILSNGVLKQYSLNDQKKSKTSVDPTFYPQHYSDGSISDAKFNFNDIVNAEIVATDVGMQEIVINSLTGKIKAYDSFDVLEDGDEVKKVKRVRLLLFIAFKTKVVVISYVFYPEDYKCNLALGQSINFNENSRDILVLETVDPSNKNSLNFLELSDIRVKGNYLFVVDKKLNMVLRYDIEFIRVQQALTGWNIKNIRLLDILQGEGSIRDNLYFNAPCSICADDKNIYVADRGNGCIKKFSEEFDYISTIRNGNFVDQDIQTISLNPYSFTLDNGIKLEPNSLWVFSSTGTSLFVHILNGKNVVYSHQISKVDLLKDKFMWDEEFKSVKFSFTNSNYYYLCTSKRVYKIHLSKPFYPFASISYFKQRFMITSMVWSRIPYPWHVLPSDEDGERNITWSYHPTSTSAEILDNKAFCLCGVDDYTRVDENNVSQFNGDLILHIGNLYDQSKIDTFCKRNNCTFSEIPQYELSQMIQCSGLFLYNETTSWLSSLSRLDFPAYITEDINEIDSSEYVNHITFNKMMYKIIYNLVNLKNHVIGRFWGAYNLDNIMTYDQLEYDDFFQSLKIENFEDLFVHSNESMSLMINRIFEKIYDLQEKILRHMEAQYRAISSFTNNSFRII